MEAEGQAGGMDGRWAGGRERRKLEEEEEAGKTFLKRGGREEGGI